MHVVCERFLQKTSTHGSDGLRLCSERASCETAGFSDIWCCKRQSLNERQREFAWQIDHSTNDRLSDAKFAVKLRMRAVCEARPLGTPVFIWSPALISYRAVKPPVFIYCVVQVGLMYMYMQAHVQLLICFDILFTIDLEILGMKKFSVIIFNNKNESGLIFSLSYTIVNGISLYCQVVILVKIIPAQTLTNGMFYCQKFRSTV